MKSVLVTGGTIRLGAAIADCLRAKGWRVITSSHRADAGSDIVADLSAPDGADALFDAATALLGGRAPDALVNNAALFSDTPGRLTQVNVVSPMRLMERMAAVGGRRAVVNVLDCRVLDNSSPTDAYSASKRALLDATRTAAIRLAPQLRVNGVAPGPVLAPIGVREKAGRTLLGRPTPKDVAAAVAFLLDATATTGCVVPVDGGNHLFSGGEDGIMGGKTS